MFLPSGEPRNRYGLFFVSVRLHYWRTSVALLNQCFGDILRPYRVRFRSQYIFGDVFEHPSGGRNTHFSLSGREAWQNACLMSSLYKVNQETEFNNRHDGRKAIESRPCMWVQSYQVWQFYILCVLVYRLHYTWWWTGPWWVMHWRQCVGFLVFGLSNGFPYRESI